jgi:hypothetical protein
MNNLTTNTPSTTPKLNLSPLPPEVNSTTVAEPAGDPGTGLTSDGIDSNVLGATIIEV